VWRKANMNFVRLRADIPAWLRTYRWRLVTLFACVLAPLYLFGFLADEIVVKESFFFDSYLPSFLHSHATAPLDRAMLFFTLIGSGTCVVPFDILVFFVLAGRRRWSDTYFWVLATGGAALLNVSAKHAFERVRPDLWQSIAPETTFSFPSAHAMQSMALVAALSVLAWPTRWRWPVLIVGTCFVLLVGLSRIYLGVHYPSDVLAGWAASLAWVCGLSIAFHGHLTKDDGPPMPP
jgi:membrane-associated phospholipid phosphatase